MAGPLVNPFTDEDYRKINDQLTALDRLRGEIQQAALAGCEVGERLEQCQKLQQQLSQMKQVYFSDKP